MPYVTVTPGVDLYYELRKSTASNPSEKPWLLSLHPVFLDLTFAEPYVEGKGDLLERFNIIMIDFRCHGRTISKVSPCCDLWSLATDLAIALDKLMIGPVHVLAGDSLGTEVSMRLAGLFPESVTSICMCAMPPETEQGFIQTAFYTMLSAWVNPEFPEDWESSVLATQWWLYGPRADHNLNVLDSWAGTLIRRYPPCKAVKSLGSCIAYTEREPPPQSLYSLVRVPVLALHGDFENIYDVSKARARFNKLVNAGPGSEFIVLTGAPLSAYDANPKIVKANYYPWIDAQLASSPQLPPRVRPNFVAALQLLSELYNDPSIAKRDPYTPESFYGLTEEKVKSNTERLEYLSEVEKSKFSFFGGNAPERWTGASFEEMHPWRFSSRFKTESGTDGVGDIAEEIMLAITESTLDEDDDDDDAINAGS
ncbi:Alpha/Beta hydrolase protein [Melampsora americana]|nr:Alpha/Beta hydrolase protein [Melampsora americana]